MRPGLGCSDGGPGSPAGATRPMAARRGQLRDHAKRVLLRAPVPGGQRQPRGTRRPAPCRRDDRPVDPPGDAAGLARLPQAACDRCSRRATGSPADRPLTHGRGAPSGGRPTAPRDHKAVTTHEGQRRSRERPSRSPGEAATQRRSLPPPLRARSTTPARRRTRRRRPAGPGPQLCARAAPWDSRARLLTPAPRPAHGHGTGAQRCWGQALRELSWTDGTEDTGTRDNPGRARRGPDNARHAERGHGSGGAGA